jgi:hypothetical protein
MARVPGQIFGFESVIPDPLRYRHRRRVRDNPATCSSGLQSALPAFPAQMLAPLRGCALAPGRAPALIAL